MTNCDKSCGISGRTGYHVSAGETEFDEYVRAGCNKAKELVGENKGNNN